MWNPSCIVHDRRQGGRSVIVQHGMIDGGSSQDLVQEVMQKKEKVFGHSVVRGFQWIGAGMILQAVLRIGVLAALTRMVEPKEFGLLGIAFICTSCAERIGQVGIGPAFIQKSEIDDNDVRTAQILSLASGLVIMLALWALAPIVAHIFREPKVVLVLSVLAVGFVVDAFVVVPDGMLQRQLRFREIVRAETFSYILGPGLVGITGAALGFGVWALVCSHLVMKIFRAILTRGVVVMPQGGRYTRVSAGGLFSKGVGFSAGRILNFISLQGDNFVVGRALGTEALGMYSRAYQLMAIPAMFVGQLFERVLFPALAQKQEDVLTMQRAFRASLEVSTMVALPVSIVMYNLSDEIVEVLFGSRWLSISPVLSILALGVFCRTTYKCGDTVIRSQGEMLGYTTRQVWYTGTVFVGSFIGATWFGIIGVAWAVVAGTAINYILMTQLAARLIAMPYTAVLYSHLPGIWISLCLGTVFTWGLQPLRTLGLNPFLTLLAVGFVSIAVVVAALTLGWGLIRKTSSFELGARYFARRVRPDTIVQAA